MEMLKKESIIALLFLSITFAGCSQSDSSNNRLSTSGNGPSITDITIENIPNFGIEKIWSINSSDPNKLYLGTYSAIIEVDKNTWAKRTIVGNTYETVYQPGGAFLSVSYPLGIQLHEGNVYAGTSSGRVVSGFTGTDQFETVNIYLPGMPGNVNGLDLVTSNSTTLYYGGYYGIYAKTYDSMDAPILLYPKSNFNAIATDDALYVITYLEGPQYYLMKYDLITGQSTTLRSNLKPQPGSGVGVFPMTRSGANIYWLDGGCSIYGLDTTSGDVSLLSNMDLCNIYEIVADDNYLYARNWYEIDKVSLATGVTVTIPTNEPVWSFAVDAGKIYYATGYSGFQIRMIDETQQITPLLDLQNLGSSSLSLIKVATCNSKLIVTTGEKAFIYDIASQSLESITTHTGYVLWVHDGKIYSGYREVVTMPINKQIRPVTEIYPAYPDVDINSPSDIITTAIDANSIYWITRGLYNGLNPYYRISKAAHDGSSYQQLYEGSEELRDLALHNGKLFFTCYADCGDPGWVLASMPVTGGTPTPEFGLIANPLTYYKNGIFYVVDTYDLESWSLFAINIETLDYKELLSGLYYDAFRIALSSKWLYVAKYRAMYGPPSGGLSRFPFIAWNDLGAEQIVFDQNTTDLNGFIIGTISTDDKHLYYWHDGLKRIAE
jgi:hypothetical protein